MSARRWLLAVVGLGLWAFGLYLLVGGNYIVGGGSMITGGLCIVVAASGGWTEFWDGLSNWLYFWR